MSLRWWWSDVYVRMIIKYDKDQIDDDADDDDHDCDVDDLKMLLMLFM